MIASALLAACQPAGPEPQPRADAEPDTRPDAGVEYAPGDVEAPPWLNPLSARIGEADIAMPGRLGVYVRRLGEAPGSLDMGGEEPWYLGAAVRVAVAIVVLEQVDAGQLSLEDDIELREADLVDGPGNIGSRPPGERFTIAALLEASLRDSDSVATDMLIRQVGEVDLNRRIREWLGRGFGQVTTHLQERYKAYGVLHPGVAKLTNADLIRVQEAGEGDARLDALAAQLEVERDALGVESLEAVFDDYYATGANAWPLEMVADMLELLVTGELLTPESTRLLLGQMRATRAGPGGIQAGLPAGADFAHAAGSGPGRACQMGVLNADTPEQATIVVACAADFEATDGVEQAFRDIGRALGDAGLARLSRSRDAS